MEEKNSTLLVALFIDFDWWNESIFSLGSGMSGSQTLGITLSLLNPFYRWDRASFILQFIPHIHPIVVKKNFLTVKSFLWGRLLTMLTCSNSLPEHPFSTLSSRLMECLEQFKLIGVHDPKRFALCAQYQYFQWIHTNIWYLKKLLMF